MTRSKLAPLAFTTVSLTSKPKPLAFGRERKRGTIKVSFQYLVGHDD
jgi:hypothetical protein